MSKKLLVSSLVISLLFAWGVGFGSAQEVDLPDSPSPEESAQQAEQVEETVDLYQPRILPDSPLYFLKRAVEKVRVFLTFNPVGKAKIFVQLAEKRIAESKVLIERGKTEKAEKILTEYQENLDKALAETKEVRSEEEKKAMEEVIAKVSEATQRHWTVLERVYQEKVPEPAKAAIARALEMSKKGYQRAIEALSKTTKEDVSQKGEEIKEKAKEGLKELGKKLIEEPSEKIEETLESKPKSEDKPAELYLFWGQGCPHCVKAKAFLVELKGKHPQLIVREYETYYNQENRELFQSLAAAYNSQASGVPTIFIGEKAIIGFSDSLGLSIEREVINCLQKGCPSPMTKIK